MAKKSYWIVAIMLIIFLNEVLICSIMFPARLKILPSWIAESPDNFILNASILSELWPGLLLMAPLFGYASDLSGRKKWLGICILASLIACLLYALGFFQDSLFILLVAGLSLSTSTTMLSIIQAAIVDITKGYQKSSVFALLTATIFLVYPLQRLATLLYTETNFSLFFLCAMASILALVNMGLLYFCLPETAFLSEKSNSKIQHLSRSLAEGIASILAVKPLLFTLIISFLFEMAWSLHYQEVNSFKLLSSPHSALEFFQIALYRLSFLIGSLMFVYPIFIRLFSSKKALLIAIILSMMSIAMSYYLVVTLVFEARVPSSYMAWGINFVTPLLWTLLSDLAPEHYKGLTMGIGISIWSLAGMFSEFFLEPLLQLHQALPSLTIIFILSICVFLILGLMK